MRGLLNTRDMRGQSQLESYESTGRLTIRHKFTLSYDESSMSKPQGRGIWGARTMSSVSENNDGAGAVPQTETDVSMTEGMGTVLRCI